jgi:hypothetical protein
MDMTLIDQYARGDSALAQAIQGLTRADLLATPVPGTWTLQQIVIHLMDSDLIGSDRMKRVIAEENPILIGYDEAAFSRQLHYDKQDAAAAAEIFRLNRQLTAVILRNVPPAAFARVGTHNERGKVSLGDLVATYVAHLEHHLTFIRHKRQLLGKPLP